MGKCLVGIRRARVASRFGLAKVHFPIHARPFVFFFFSFFPFFLLTNYEIRRVAEEDRGNRSIDRSNFSIEPTKISFPFVIVPLESF